MKQFGISRRGFLGLIGISMLPVVSGCGGANTIFAPKPDPIETSPTNRAYLTINWQQLGRALDGPTSARSAKITIKKASINDQSDVVFIANRDSTKPGSHSATYESGQGIYTGKRNIVIEFYTLPEAAGNIVASASALIGIESNGQIQQAITLERKVGSVEVAAGQIVTAGTQIYLTYTVKDIAGNVIAVAPGSAQFTVTTGSDKVTTVGEVATGKSGGTASVTATVDGLTSAPSEITIQASVRVALIANPDDAEVVAFKQYLIARSVTFTAYNDVPDAATLQNFDVMMVTGDMAQNAYVGPDDAVKVKAYLDSGRGVILFGNAPLKLTGSNDTKSIASWFGGVNDINGPTKFYGAARKTTGGIFNLPLTINTTSLVTDGGIHAYWINKSDVINPALEPVLTNMYGYQGDFYSAFAFVPTSGGRLYWQGHPYSTDTQYSSKVIDLLLAATNWAGGR